MKKVSILLTKQKDGEQIYKCINSLVNQTYPNLEIIILDSGYKDSNRNYIYSQAALHENIFIFTKKYAPLAVLRQLGIQKATGEYILFVTPKTILNLNAVDLLMKNMIQAKADIAMGSFFHPYYKQYLNNATFILTEPKDFICFQRNFISNMMLTTKLYKKSLFDDIKFKSIYLNEAYLYLDLLKKAKIVVTTEKILFSTTEFSNYFEQKRFWENCQSFWYLGQKSLEYRKNFYNKNKKLLPNITATEFLNLGYLDYLIWELLSYAKHNATIEALTMELYHVWKEESFKSALEKLQMKGLVWKKLNEDELLAHCILYADLLVKKISFLQDDIAQISVMKLCYMLFVKIFFKQNGQLDGQCFLCEIREELTLNESKEAKYINGLNL
ncbi:MAG: glycosyltransferase family 2 protein [Roseburia sp.]|nr:glycosyltransferase family 2 protein [Anaeroplasma bactoclasticum]MCM1195870.1 glycosyltransferase family 2 protein [Roseburia sp.]MCM1556542.1 glycosyltransferase family 2 protein [Anaeroplasma bactoclasticum]